MPGLLVTQVLPRGVTVTDGPVSLELLGMERNLEDGGVLLGMPFIGAADTQIMNL